MVRWPGQADEGAGAPPAETPAGGGVFFQWNLWVLGEKLPRKGVCWRVQVAFWGRKNHSSEMNVVFF